MAVALPAVQLLANPLPCPSCSSWYTHPAPSPSMDPLTPQRLHACRYGRVALSCPTDQLGDIQEAAQAKGYTVLTPRVKLDTPGKATVEVVILADPDGHEVHVMVLCFALVWCDVLSCGVLVRDLL